MTKKKRTFLIIIAIAWILITSYFIVESYLNGSQFVSLALLLLAFLIGLYLLLTDKDEFDEDKDRDSNPKTKNKSI